MGMLLGKPPVIAYGNAVRTTPVVFYGDFVGALPTRNLHRTLDRDAAASSRFLSRPPPAPNAPPDDQGFHSVAADQGTHGLSRAVQFEIGQQG